MAATEERKMIMIRVEKAEEKGVPRELRSIQENQHLKRPNNGVGVVTVHIQKTILKLDTIGKLTLLMRLRKGTGQAMNI